MRITGRGHPSIRATHAKTLELTPDTALTERATCVVATSVVVEPPRPLAGPVRITITAGGHRAVVHARANPEWDPAGPAVIRRSPLRLPGTLATHADLAAAQLPRELVAALRDPAAVVVVEVDAEPDDDQVLVLVAAAAASRAAVAAELEIAGSVVAEDAAARRLVGASRSAPGRTVVVAVDDLPGVSAPSAGARVETLGLTPAFAVAVACPSRAPLAFVDEPGRLAELPAGYRVVLRTPADGLDPLLAQAGRVRGTERVTLAQRHITPWSHTVGEPLDLPVRDPVWCCLHPAPERPDPRVHAAITALLAEGVPTRAAARALAELTGWPRRRAYDAVLELGRSGRAPALRSGHARRDHDGPAQPG